MTKIYQITFILIFFLAAMLRFWKLDSFPNSLNWDEISHGYNAYSLLQTGQDQWGINWPLFNFRAYGDYPTTLNMYLTIPVISLFGLNSLSVRLPSAICGLLTVLISYYLGKYIFKKNLGLSLLLMLLVAISPWTLYPSRAVFQSTVAQFFFLGGLTWFLYGLSTPRYFIFSSFFLGISQYGYHNTRLIVPLMTVALIINYWPLLKKISFSHLKILSASFIIFLLFTIPSLVNLLSTQSQARGTWVSIINPGSISYLEEKLNNYPGNPVIGHLIYNKVSYFVPKFLSNYLSFLNPLPLFYQGSQNYQFNVPNFGLIYSVFLPFYYLGIILLIYRSLHRDRHSRILLLWFIIGLLPAVITTGDFPLIRAFTIIPLPFIFIIIGLQRFVLFLPTLIKNIFYFLLAIICFFNFLNYLNQYFNYYPQNYSYSWQYGYQSAVNYLKQHYFEYDKIFFTKKYGEPHEYILFYWPWNPASYQTDNQKKWDYHSYWYWLNSFDKFIFVNDWEISNYPLPSNSLLITSPNNYNKTTGRLLETIYYPNHQPVFDIVQISYEN